LPLGLLLVVALELVVVLVLILVLALVLATVVVLVSPLCLNENGAEIPYVHASSLTRKKQNGQHPVLFLTAKERPKSRFYTCD
jgi:hypothetical protein